jgi:NADH:ubiquinone oxidoreductase subunit E
MSETNNSAVHEHTHSKDANVLELLKERQNKYGHISEDFIAETAKNFNMPVGEVYGVATFYSFLTTKLKGRNVIRVCRSVPCFLKNSEMIVNALKKQLGTDIGDTTTDNRFTLELTNCIGECDKSPAIMINHDVYGDLTPDKLTAILAKYK